MKKRQFLRYMGSAAMVTPFMPLTLNAQETSKETPYPNPDSNEFWDRIRMDFKLKPDYINLESGYYNITTTPILDKYMDHIRELNYEWSYNGKTNKVLLLV